MRFALMIEPQQGLSYAEQLAVVQRAESLGFESFFRSDHYQSFPGPSGEPTTDAWAVLAGLARETTTIGLGTLVSPVTFRPAPVLAKSVVTADHVSGGRVELGIGAGWYEAEHAAYGISFPALGERFDRLEEQLAVITGLWSTPAGERFAFDGEHYTVSDSPALPKPVQERIPVIVGGSGPKRTPRLAATYATEFNTPFLSLDDFVVQRETVVAACEVIGRDPASLTLSAALVACVGDDASSYERRAAAIGREAGELRANGLAGVPEEAADTMGRWHEAGAERLYLQVLDLADLEHLDTLAALAAPTG